MLARIHKTLEEWFVVLQCTIFIECYAPLYALGTCNSQLVFSCTLLNEGVLNKNILKRESRSPGIINKKLTKLNVYFVCVL